MQAHLDTASPHPNRLARVVCRARALSTGSCHSALLSPVECDPATQFMCVDQSKCVSIRFRCETNHIPDCEDGSDEKNCNLTGKTVMAVV